MDTLRISALQKKIWDKPFLRNSLQMIFFGSLSLLFGEVKFYIPGIEGGLSDLREIPLLTSIFYLSNPLYTIGMSAITSLATPPDGSYLTTFLMHSIGLFISWYFYNYLKKQNISVNLLSIIWLGYIVIYYTLILLPILILTNYLVGLNLDEDFVSFYLSLIESVRFEIVSSSIIVSLFLIQYKYRKELKKHLDDLENTVKERTEELSSVLKELQSAQQYLIQAEKMSSLGTLSAGIAHEICNPLNYIQGGSYIISGIEEDILDNISGEAREEFKTAVEGINNGLARANSIVEALMTFTSREPSKLLKADLHEIIENTLLFLSHKIPENTSITKDFELNFKIPLYADKVHHIILNIIDNAIFEIKTNNRSKGLISISTKENKEYATLEISNNGGQVPEHQIDQIFDPFFTTKDPGSGVGLGLSIVYTLVSDHKGKIKVKNIVDGVSFIIELPIQ